MVEELRSVILNRKNSADITFWFVRHAESEGNMAHDFCPVMHDTPLTLHGRQEADRLVSYFRGNQIKVTDVYSSPRIRSKQTAEMLAQAYDLSIKVKEDLNERDWGVLKDLRWVEVSRRLDAFSIQERYEFVPPGGESWRQMEMRLFKAFLEIAKENESCENVVIVMHKGGLRAVLPRLVAKSIEVHAQFSVETGSISKFSFSKNELEFIGLVP